MRERCYAVIVAAGKGTRMGGSLPKQLMRYRGATVLERAVEPFFCHPEIDGVVLVLPEEEEQREPFADAVRRIRRFGKELVLARGGRTRALSVQNGLAAAEALAAKQECAREHAFVLIHDAARPDADAAVIDRNLAALSACDAVCTAVPAIDSLRSISNAALSSEVVYPIMDSKVLRRETVFCVQTPQSFRLSTIAAAYERANEDGYEGTDDASVAEYAGVEVALVEGTYANRKITTRKDIPMNIRVGTGYDVHRLAEGRRLILCGVPLPSNRGLLGHSDADVAAHALMDAILGAAGKGDIGQHFPDTDEKYLGADSMELLAETKRIAGAENIVNVDVTIVAEKPKIAPYIEEMKNRIAEALAMPVSAVNVKATTTEGLGFVGREEGIAAIATCAIEGRF